MPGDKVRFSLAYTAKGELTARVETIYGSADSARICADAIIDSAGIPHVFPAEVLAEAESLRRGEFPTGKGKTGKTCGMVHFHHRRPGCQRSGRRGVPGKEGGTAGSWVCISRMCPIMSRRDLRWTGRP